MGKIAFVFPGQGAQYPGMALTMFNNRSEAKAVFELADKIRPGTMEQCLYGTEDDLKITKITQPAMYTAEMAIAAVLDANGIKADAVAGFSLGELSALTYAKVFDIETGISLVSKRGEFMQEDAEKTETSMAAVVKLDKENVEKLCFGFEGVYPVNYNCPGQISVAGLAENMLGFSDAVKSAGGRAIPIKVSGGFHSPFMREASEKFGEILEGVSFRKPEITVYSNLLGDEYGDDIKTVLKDQICHPVLWQNIIEKMIKSGVDTFVEVGPGKTLTGFTSKINSEVKTFHVAEMEDLDLLLKEI